MQAFEMARQKAYGLAERAQADLFSLFEEIDINAQKGTERVLAAFKEYRVSDGDFAGKNGYGYDDTGRDKLEKIYAMVFGAEDALVRMGFVNGTHAIAAALWGATKPGGELVSITGAPYDTLAGVIAGNRGSLRENGVGYREVPLDESGRPDMQAIEAALKTGNPCAVLIQRSRGYGIRPALSVDEIGQLVQLVKGVNPYINVVVDNCYGEFVDDKEPTHVGADLIAGSLIKNPGGGLAQGGGYVIGKHELVELAAEFLTVPGIGRECGGSLGHNREMYQGLAMAPHTTAQALKTAALCARMMELLGYDVSPASDEKRHDIIQTINFGAPEPLVRFCRGIQAASPVDSFASPEPWDMPGYDCPVIMAAGAFVQGSSIELSCDAPMRMPYTAYMQGGLTYELGKLGIIGGVAAMVEENE